jgi:hypothetical protein
MTENRKRVTVRVTGQQRSATIRAPAQAVAREVEIETLPVREVVTPAYTGPYIVMPSANEQTLATEGMRMTGNVTVAPIPNNYGLITWDGSKLRVS